ncbi:MAG: hypothetical protein HC880_03070 [Bacteroidia bacterium]|nr:hypothetical protein [Bacteroidia bacterium]
MILNWKQLGPLYDTKDMVVQLRQGGVGIPTKKDQKLLGDSQAGLSDKKTASKREQLAVSILETGLSMIGQDDRKKRVNDYNKLVELLNTYKDTKEGT